METIKFSFVTDRCYPFYEGGYERHTWDLATRLAKNDRVTVLTSLPVPSASISGVEFVRVSPYLPYTKRRGTHSPIQSAIFALAEGAALGRVNRQDFVDVQGIPYLHVPLTRLKLTLSRGKWAVTVPETWHNYPPGTGLTPVLTRSGVSLGIRLSVSGDHGVFVFAQTIAASLNLRFGVAKRRISIVSPGVDIRAVDAAPVGADHNTVICVNRLDSFKRTEDVLAAVQLLRRRGELLTLGIVGEGPERNRLESLATHHQQGQATFYGGVNNERKFSLLKSSEIFVLASEREGFSISTLEAMACGACPVVARPSNSDLFGVADLVTEGVNGMIYPVGDIEALANCIAKLVRDEGLRSRLATQAHQTALRFDLGLTVDRYREAAIHVLGSN